MFDLGNGFSRADSSAGVLTPKPCSSSSSCCAESGIRFKLFGSGLNGFNFAMATDGFTPPGLKTLLAKIKIRILSFLQECVDFQATSNCRYRFSHHYFDQWRQYCSSSRLAFVIRTIPTIRRINPIRVITTATSISSHRFFSGNILSGN